MLHHTWHHSVCASYVIGHHHDHASTKLPPGPGTERHPDGTKTFHAPFILPWVWDAAPEGSSQAQGVPGGPAFVEYHADSTHGARLLVAVDDGSGGGQGTSGSVSGYNTVFSLGKTAPQGGEGLLVTCLFLNIPHCPFQPAMT